MASIEVYGYVAQEMVVENEKTDDTFHKLHVIFAIVDAKQTRLAWYLFGEDVAKSGQPLFDLVSVGSRKLDRNEVFGEAISYPTVNSYDGSDIGRLGPRLPSIGAPAKLFMTDHKDKTTTCKISHLIDLDSNLVSLQFDLVTPDAEERIDRVIRDLREIGTKKGHVWLLGVERFSRLALKRGIRGRSKLTNNIDPYDPIY